MTQIWKGVRTGAVILLSFIVIAFSSVPTFAIGPQGPTGPQGNVGPQTEVGPQGSTGPQGGVGPRYQPTPAPTSSSEQSAQSNTGTGNDSENKNASNSNNSTNASNNNNANVNNDVNVNATTGKNEVTGNTNVGTTTTGDINGTVDVINVLNSQFGEGSSVGSQVVGGNGDITLGPINNRTALNSSTGNGSQNSNRSNSANDLNILNRNDATANNLVVINANTGDNLIANNTNATGLQTGNINLGVTDLTIANSIFEGMATFNVYTMFGDLVGDLILGNRNTGTDSSNNNTAKKDTDTKITTTNTANISNQVDFNGNTGKNNVSGNTGAATPETGAINVKATVTNVANVANPLVYVFNVMGTLADNWMDSLVGLDPSATVIVNQMNENTGEGSENTNQSSDKSSVDITNTNNATINNKVQVNANTGRNTVTGNTNVNGPIKTGSINFVSNMVNVANVVSSLPNVTLNIFNLFGDWKGKPKQQTASTAGTSDSQGSSNSSTTNNSVAATSKDGKQTVGSTSSHNSGSGILSKVKHSLGQKSDSSVSTLVSSADNANVLNSSDGDGVFVKAYTSAGVERAKTISSQLMSIMAIALGFILLWVVSEVVTAKQKRRS